MLVCCGPITARNGQEALGLYRSETADLVVTDLIMPKMGGQELVQRLRTRDANIKALAITGYVIRNGADQWKQMGFLGVVEKPFDVEELAQAVRGALDNS